MSDNNIELTRRRVLGGIATVGAASAAAGAGTFAFFSDTETSTDNAVQAGTVDLNSPNSTVSYSVGDEIAPGESFTLQIETTYTGSIDGVTLNLNAQLAEPSSDPDSSNESTDNTTDLSATQFASAVTASTAKVEIVRDSSVVASDDLLSSDSPSNPISKDIDISSGTVDDGGSYEVSGSDLADVVSDGLSEQTEYATLQTDDTVRIYVSGTLDSDLGNDGQEDGVNVQVAFGVQQSDATPETPTVTPSS